MGKTYEFIVPFNPDTMPQCIADVVVASNEKLIRCKDCEHRKRQFGKDVYCQLVSNIMPEDGYCSMAVWKDAG